MFATTDDELDRIVTAPDWCVFLHPRSTGWRAPTTTSTSCSSRAAPAPGKTLIALHRAAHLAVARQRASCW
ncbi:hypothetical protein GCM10020219_090590 [Nonomuraea dietziae]